MDIVYAAYSPAWLIMHSFLTIGLFSLWNELMKITAFHEPIKLLVYDITTQETKKII